MDIGVRTQGGGLDNIEARQDRGAYQEVACLIVGTRKQFIDKVSEQRFLHRPRCGRVEHATAPRMFQHHHETGGPATARCQQRSHRPDLTRRHGGGDGAAFFVRQLQVFPGNQCHAALGGQRCQCRGGCRAAGHHDADAGWCLACGDGKESVEGCARGVLVAVQHQRTAVRHGGEKRAEVASGEAGNVEQILRCQHRQVVGAFVLERRGSLRQVAEKGGCVGVAIVNPIPEGTAARMRQIGGDKGCLAGAGWALHP